MTDTTITLGPGLPLADSTIPTSNDIRRWVYNWFTMFEHRVQAERLVAHLADGPLSLSFPGGAPLRSGAEFAAWYAELLANTKWNFHELTNITVEATSTGSRPRFDVGFDVSWQGQTVDGSVWQSNLPDGQFRYEVHQDWKVTSQDGDALDNPFKIVNIFAAMK